MNKFWVITKEVYKKNVKSFGFITMVLSPLILIAVIAGIGYYFSRDTETEPTPIAIITEQEMVQEMFVQEDLPFEVQEEWTTEAEAREALINEDIQGYLLISTDNSDVTVEMVHDESLSDYTPIFSEMLSNLQTALRAEEIGVSPEEAAALSEPIELDEQIVRIEEGQLTEEDASDTFLQQGSAYFVSIAIMMFIMTYAGIIAEEVANEKGTRIMEIILSSATATNHFFGKLTGVMLILLTQLVLYGIVGTIAYYFVRDKAFIQEITSSIDIVSILRELMGYTAIFFVLGVLMYVVLAAFFGSLATKMEDVNKAVTPIVFLALIGFYVGMFALNAPDNIVSVIFSYIPLFTPFVMPFRIAAETVSTVGIWLSIIGTAAFCALLTFVSLLFYRSNVLIYSDSNIFGTIKRSWSIMQSNRKAKKQHA